MSAKFVADNKQHMIRRWNASPELPAFEKNIDTSEAELVVRNAGKLGQPRDRAMLFIQNILTEFRSFGDICCYSCFVILKGEIIRYFQCQ